MKIKRIFCGILTAAMLLGQTGAVWAEATDTASESPTPTPDPHTEYYAQAADTDSIEGWPEGPKIEAQSAVLMDLNTEAVLYSKNANTQLYPASITKLLTCLLGCENLDVNAQLTLSQQAAYGIEAGSSTIYGDAGLITTKSLYPFFVINIGSCFLCASSDISLVFLKSLIGIIVGIMNTSLSCAIIVS